MVYLVLVYLMFGQAFVESQPMESKEACEAILRDNLDDAKKLMRDNGVVFVSAECFVDRSGMEIKS